VDTDTATFNIQLAFLYPLLIHNSVVHRLLLCRDAPDKIIGNPGESMPWTYPFIEFPIVCIRMSFWCTVLFVSQLFLKYIYYSVVIVGTYAISIYANVLSTIYVGVMGIFFYYNSGFLAWYLLAFILLLRVVQQYVPELTLRYRYYRRRKNAYVAKTRYGAFRRWLDKTRYGAF
jgi:hypothetical protein